MDCNRYRYGKHRNNIWEYTHPITLYLLVTKQQGKIKPQKLKCICFGESLLESKYRRKVRKMGFPRDNVSQGRIIGDSYRYHNFILENLRYVNIRLNS